MTLGGWIFMGLSIASVLALTAACYLELLRTR